MRKAIIYGVGKIGHQVYELCHDKYDVIAFSDSNPNKWGKLLEIDGELPIIPPFEIKNIEYDNLLLGSLLMDELFISQLTEKYEIPVDKIDKEYISSGKLGFHKAARETFLRYESRLLQELEGNVAEGGVYLGEFSAIINEIFPNRYLHLFDTFEGFDQRDIIVEQSQGFSISKYDAGYFSDDGFSIKNLLSKMPHSDRVIIHKGYFPASVVGDKQLEDERFIFVNLDFDLYNPTLAGLNFFYPRIVSGGVILIHDYFNDAFKGVEQAVRDFACNNDVRYFAVGDGFSVAIVKN